MPNLGRHSLYIGYEHIHINARSVRDYAKICVANPVLSCLPNRWVLESSLEFGETNHRWNFAFQE